MVKNYFCLIDSSLFSSSLFFENGNCFYLCRTLNIQDINDRDNIIRVNLITPKTQCQNAIRFDLLHTTQPILKNSKDHLLPYCPSNSAGTVLQLLVSLLLPSYKKPLESPHAWPGDVFKSHEQIPQLVK